MLSKKTYIAFLVFFVMELPTCIGQTIMSDSIMNQYNLVVLNDSSQVAAYGNVTYNQPHGDWVYFNRRGGKMTEGKFKKGKKHGIWYFYDVFGDLLTTGKYKKGKMHGVWKFHYLSNQCESKYKDNLKISTTCLDE